MRRFLPALAAACLLGGGPAASAPSTITLASAQNSIASLPIYVAEMNGFFAAEGLKIEILDFRGGGPAVQALAGGGVDLCICAGDHAVRLRSRGLPARIVVGLTEQHGYGLLALAQSPVTDIASMKGRKLGITSPGSLTDNTVRYALRRVHLDPDRDVVLASIGTGIPMKAALDSGAIDAGMFTTPDLQSNLAEGGKYKIVQDYRDLDYPALDVIALESWLKKDDKVARAFVRSIVRAEQLIQSDPDAVRAGIKKMFPTFDDKLVALLVEDVPKHLSHKGEVSKAAYETMVDMLGSSEPELKSVSFNDVVSTNFLPK